MKFSMGDLFEVQADEQSKRLFQYLCDDSTQLGSQVVRVFQASYGNDETPDFSEILQNGILFHAHVFLKIGAKHGFWIRIGNAKVDQRIEILFRDSADYGNPTVEASKDWFVWKIDGHQQHVGELSSAFEHAEIGVVVPPDSLLHRIRYGVYDFVYPGF